MRDAISRLYAGGTSSVSTRNEEAFEYNLLPLGDKLGLASELKRLKVSSHFDILGDTTKSQLTVCFNYWINDGLRECFDAVMRRTIYSSRGDLHFDRCERAVKFRFRKPNLDNLWSEYQALETKAEAHFDDLEKIPLSETSPRLRIAKKTIESYGRANEAVLEIIERFSPNAASELKLKLGNHLKISKASLGEDEKKRLISLGLPESSVKDIINHKIDNSLKFTELNRQIINITFVAILEAVKGKPPKEFEEYLKMRLRKLNPEYLNLYEGAWKALESDSPDKFRHCATSTRELVVRLLGKGSKRKEKLRNILNSGVEIELVESLADSVESIYRALNKGVHSDFDFETALLCLKITEHLMHYIFERETSIRA